jgi:hypothetical protein
LDVAIRTRTHRLRREVLAAGVVAVLTLEVAAVTPSLTASLNRLGHADPSGSSQPSPRLRRR